jgi:hypothetical protein
MNLVSMRTESARMKTRRTTKNDAAWREDPS